MPLPINSMYAIPIKITMEASTSIVRGDRSTVYHILRGDTTKDIHIYSFSVMNEQDQHDSHLSSSADVDDTKLSATENDGTTATATATSPQPQPIVDMEDVWATSEGYTPLQDFNLMLQQSTPTATTTTSSNIHPHTNESNVVVPTSSGAFFSDGTTGGTIFTSCPGAFYASIAQQQLQLQQPDNDDDEWENDGGDDDDEVLDVHEDYNYLHNEDDDDDDDEDDDGDMTTTAATTTTTTSTSFYDSIPDYRSVADNALLMLDREYNSIISLPRLLQQQRRMDNEPVVVEEADHDHNDDTDDDSNNNNNNNDDSQWVIDGGTNETNNVDSIDSVLPTTLMMMTPPSPLEPKKIDTEAVRRAVRTIQSKNPKLEQNLRRWEKTQQLQHLVPPLRPHPPSSMTHPHHHHHHPSCSSMAPRLHPIIPELPLTAFRKFNSSKAIQATANLTRSVCIAEALHRYNILQYHLHQEQTIRIHILGCDHVEIGYHNTNVRSSTGGGRSSSNDATATDERRPVENAFLDPTRTRTLFGPIVRWVGAYAEAPSHIRIELIGPNIPKHVAAATKASPMDLLLPKRTTTTTHHRTGNFGSLQSATLRCHSGTYEEILEHDVGTNDVGVPDLAIAFNAGVWGYQEWATTIRYMILHQSQSIPFVITAYTFEEAEDDYDTISDIVKECRSVDHNKEVQCVWDVEHNPFASNQDYQQHSSTATIASSLYNSTRRRENSAWQSWRL